METTTTEIADGIFRFSTFVPDAGIPFNQYLVVADEPLLFHTGARQLFPLVSAAVGAVIPVETPALDHVRSRRVRRERLDEPVARGWRRSRRSRTA